MQVNCLHLFSGCSVSRTVPVELVVALCSFEKPNGCCKAWKCFAYVVTIFRILTLSFVYCNQESYHIIIQGKYFHSNNLQVTSDMFYCILWYIFNMLVDFYISFHLCLSPWPLMRFFFVSSYSSSSKQGYMNKILKKYLLLESKF